MCVAELNVSNLPCQHRWYHLVRACSASTDLENCQRKLGIKGWEIRCDFCPYCDAWSLDTTAYRLIGGRTASTTSTSLPHKPSQSLSTTRRDSRTGSLSRSDSNSSITMMTHHSVKNRATNARIDTYLSSTPDRMRSIDSMISEDDNDDDDSPAESSSSSSSNGSRPTAPYIKPSILGKSFKKTRKMSRSFFNFVK